MSAEKSESEQGHGGSGKRGTGDPVFHSEAQQALKELQGIVGVLEDFNGEGLPCILLAK